MGEDSFRQWIGEVLRDTELHFEFVAVGDGVDNIKTTQGVILKKKGA